MPLGVFRALEQPVYDDLMSEQLAAAREQRGEGDLEALLHSGDTWIVDAPGCRSQSCDSRDSRCRADPLD